MMNPVDQKFAEFRELLRGYDSVAVAFSGGVDSTFVLKAAVDVLGPDRVVGVTGRSDSVAAGEIEEARRLAAGIGVEHVILDTNEFANPNYLSNPTNRCYFCKTTLYSRLAEFASRRDMKAMVNGINADDLGDYRPGLDAAREHGVRSPAADAGLTKAEVRELSRRYGLTTHDKPASPCLSSRVPYGEAITPEKLRMIEAAESYLRGLGMRECRVRHHDRLARIEVPVDCIPMLVEPMTAGAIDAYFRALGYQYVAVDLRGFRSGSLNEVIAFGKVQPAIVS